MKTQTKMKSEELGDCIKVACELVLDNHKFLFCYAHVMGQGELKGQRIIHAWNEIDDLVFDHSNGHRYIIRKERYYAVAQIEEKDVTKQTAEEVLKLMCETETYGGWIK